MRMLLVPGAGVGVDNNNNNDDEMMMMTPIIKMITIIIKTSKSTSITKLSQNITSKSARFKIILAQCIIES